MNDRSLSGWFDGAVHRFALRVYFEDTDAGGIVYHARYLHFAERARTEMLRLAGLEHRRMMGEAGIAFAVRRCSADFLRPARLEDELEVASVVREVRGASLDLAQTVRRDGEDLVRLDVKLACMNLADGRPARLPSEARAAFGNLLNARSE